MSRDNREHIGIQAINTVILVMIGWKVFNNSFELSIFNEIITKDTYFTIFMFLGIIKLWYYYKENLLFSIVYTGLLIGLKMAFEFRFINDMPFQILVLAIVAYKMEFKSICKAFVCFAFTPALARCFGVLIGAIEDNASLIVTESTHSSLLGKNDIHCLGYGNHNSLALALFAASLAVIFLFYYTNKIWGATIIIVAINAIIFYFTDSQTAFICVVGISILVFFFKLLAESSQSNKTLAKGLNRAIHFLMAIAPTLSFAITCFAVFYSNKMMNIGKPGTTFSGRFRLLSAYLATYNVRLFNEPLEYANITRENINWLNGPGIPIRPMDNVWHCALFYGIPYLVVFFILFQRSAIRAYKEKNTPILLIITAYAVLGLMENIGTSNTRGIILYLPFVTMSISAGDNNHVQKVHEKNPYIKWVGIIYSLVLMVIVLINNTFILTRIFPVLLFVLALYMFFIWNNKVGEGHESTNN